MVPINVAGMKYFDTKDCCVKSNIKVFATQDGRLTGWTASQTNMTDYTDPYVTYTDQREKKKEVNTNWEQQENEKDRDKKSICKHNRTQ